MPIPTMETHQRTDVLRCDGCQSAARRELPATPSALRDAEYLVAQMLPAWGLTVEHIHAVQRATRSLLQPAIAEARTAMVAFTLVRHVDGIIVEVCEAVTSSPNVAMFLDLPQPRGLHWCHDAQGRLCGRLLWCGVRTTPQPHPTPRMPSAGTSPSRHGATPCDGPLPAPSRAEPPRVAAPTLGAQLWPSR